MANIKYITIILLALIASSCDYNPLNFFISSTDVNLRFDDSMKFNEGNPAQNLKLTKDEYTIMALSDLHLKSDSIYISQAYDIAENSDIDFLLFNGDLYEGREEYANYADTILKRWTKKPCYLIAGNHDLYFGWKVYFDRFGSSTYKFTVKTSNAKDLYIVLETGSATLGKKQFDWLKEQLETRDKYRYCIIITHTNFVRQSPMNGVYENEESNVLLKLFSDYNVDIVLTGHSHIAKDVNILNVRHITTGALKNGEYSTIKVSDNELDIEFEHLN